MSKSKFKGIILAGGKGSRLHPITIAVSKQLLPIYDKPMIYYSLSTLMLAEISEILIITTKEDAPLYRRLLNDGQQFGVRFEYAVQEKPDGIAQAFDIGRDFIADSPVALILGDNIFYDASFGSLLKTVTKKVKGATIFAKKVGDASQYGIVTISDENMAQRIEEKPNITGSGLAVTGLYFYDRKVVEIASTIQPSNRGELEISDLNQKYLELGELNVVTLDTDFAWFDTGTPSRMAQAARIVADKQKQNMMLCFPEQIAFENGWIDNITFQKQLDMIGETEYSSNLKKSLIEMGNSPSNFSLTPQDRED